MMMEELNRYKGDIHLVGLVEAQALYDRAMATALSPGRYRSTFPGGNRDEIEEHRLELAVAAEDFAYAFLNQHGHRLDGAADPDKFDYRMISRFAPKPILSGEELRTAIVDHLRDNYPDTLPLELR